MLPEAHETFVSSSLKHFANPSSIHMLGEDAKDEVENTRKLLAESIGAMPSEIVFTSGATESNNLVLKGVILPMLIEGKRPHLITSLTEHKCILSICNYLAQQGCDITYLRPNQHGEISCEQIEASMKENTVLVSLMQVNNELGTIAALQDIGELCFSRNVSLHTDAAQGYLKVETDVDTLNLDFLSLSAHKVGGPKGIGAAYIRDLRSLNLQPLIHGAGQEAGVRGGTLPTPLIASFGSAIEYFPKYYSHQQLSRLKTFLIESLGKSNIAHIVNGGERTLPSCLSLTLPETDVEGLLRSTYNSFAISQGSACSAGSIEPSHVLQALNIDRKFAAKTLRISFSHQTQKAEIAKLLETIKTFS